MEVDNLANFGQSYQSKTIYSLLTDGPFLEQIEDVLFTEYFESEANQWIVKIIKQHFEVFKVPPTLDVFKCELEKETNDLFKEEIIKRLSDALDYKDAQDLQYIKENFIQFCINQHYKITFYQSLDDYKKGNYSAIRKRFEDAEKVGQSRDLGLMLLDKTADTVMNQLKRKTISTPWDIINDMTEGGLAPGDLSIIVGGPGAGKSWFLCNVGSHGLKLGLNIIHYTLELDDIMIARRYYSLFTGIPSMDLKYSLSEIDSKITVYKNKNATLCIKKYPTKRASINTLITHVKKYKSMGLNPDLIVVDYADLLKPEKFYKDKRLELGNIYEELRGMAGELQVPIWTGSQANRCLFLDTNVITCDKGTIKIVNITVGDKILTHAGFKKVTFIYPIEKQPVYKIKTKGGKEILVSAKHLFPVQYNKFKSIDSGLVPGDKLFIKKQKLTPSS